MRFLNRPMLVVGVMSGTSADGIDVALAELRGRPPRLEAELAGFHFVSYPAAVRASILRVAGGGATTTAEISRLDFLLGELFARAVLRALRRWNVRPEEVHLIGSHGQTVYHQGRPEKFLGTAVRATLQIARPEVICARTKIPVMADFRPADMAHGGQGAPLVPLADYVLFRDGRRGRVALNIGGIANLTAIPPRAELDRVTAFDTGPGNMLVDALVRHYSRGRELYDRGARIARSGRLLPGMLAELLRDPFYRLPPPKSAGREQFGADAVKRILELARRARARPEDVIRTVTILTPLVVLDAYHRWVAPQLLRRNQVVPVDFILSGGGAHNPLMRAQLEAGLSSGSPGVTVHTSGEMGIPEDAKEALAFAILAYECYHGRPGSLPGATGAKSPIILGRLYPPNARCV
jgi:anhydro-N-acetylmuramic acid kinase